MIVSHEQKDIIRSHFDLEKDSAQYYKKACKVRNLSPLHDSWNPTLMSGHLSNQDTSLIRTLYGVFPIEICIHIHFHP